ncbi:MAG TPA: hypothetical protein VN089_14285, partial [Duganella sp.]|nr:hypothetical protein [Duganella sp.]
MMKPKQTCFAGQVSLMPQGLAALNNVFTWARRPLSNHPGKRRRRQTLFARNRLYLRRGAARG